MEIPWERLCMPGKSGEDNPNKDKECFNCHKKSHLKPDCWVKGRGKEGRGLEGEIKQIRQKK